MSGHDWIPGIGLWQGEFTCELDCRTLTATVAEKISISAGMLIGVIAAANKRSTKNDANRTDDENSLALFGA
jgi:hypothetical protein